MGSLGMVVVSQHHERLTGHGYPRALEPQHIHLFGRIAAIADVYDAMTSDRSYQRAMKPVDALAPDVHAPGLALRPGPAHAVRQDAASAAGVEPGQNCRIAEFHDFTDRLRAFEGWRSQ